MGIQKKLFSFVSLISLGTTIITLPIISLENKTKIGNVDSSINEVKQTNNSNTKAIQFNDYSPIANNSNSQPISTTVGVLGTNSKTGDLDGDIFGTKLYLTSYEGVTVWEFDAINNNTVKQFYLDQYKVEDLNDYAIKSWKYIEDLNVIAVILASNTNGINASVFGIKADTGLLYAPVLDANNNPKPENNIVKVNDGVNVLWINSSNKIVASKFGNFDVYSNNTHLITFDENGVSVLDAIPRNIAVDVDDAKRFVEEKKKTGSDTVNNITFNYSFESSWNIDDNGARWELQAIIPCENNSNENLAFFTDSLSFANIYTGNTFGTNLQQAVLVDDNLNPILKDNKKVFYTLDTTYACWKNGEYNNNSNLPKYGYKGTKENNKQNFIWVTSGVVNAVSEIQYDSVNKTIIRTKMLDMQRQTDQDVKTYYYDLNENKLFTSNSYTSTSTAIGYVDFNQEQLTYQKLIDGNQYMTTNFLRFSPIYSKDKIKESPVIYFNNSRYLKGKYFKNENNNTTLSDEIQLDRKTYNVDNQLESTNWYKTKLASNVTKEELLNILEFDSTPTNDDFNKSLVSYQSNDKNGSISMKYNVSYSNWWNTNTTSDFYIETNLTGMYATDNQSLDFVYILNGQTQNDQKLKKQNEFKSTIYPSQVKWSDIETYFVIPNIKDLSNNVVSLTQEMITLTPNDTDGTLGVRIDYSKTNNLPSGLSNEFLVYEHTFDGFIDLSQYKYELLFDSQSNNLIKQTLYPSEITKQFFLNNFINLGKNYSKNLDDWEYTVNTNNYKGELKVSLTYNPKSFTLPEGFPEEYKKVIDNISITGFKSVINQLNEISFNEYNGIKTNQQIWDEYQQSLNNKSSSNTTLAKLINIDYVNFDDLVITNNNSINSNELDLTISIKENTQSNIVVVDKPIVLDTNTINELKTNGFNYPFNTKIKVNTSTYLFEYIDSNGNKVDLTNSDSLINIDLNNSSYQNINKSMYANQVKKEDIISLFSLTGFEDPVVSIDYNNANGSLVATVLLKPLDEFVDDNNTTEIVKTFNITGFKKESNINVMLVALLTSVSIVLLLTCLLLYFAFIRKNIKAIKNNKNESIPNKPIDTKSNIVNPINTNVSTINKSNITTTNEVVNKSTNNTNVVKVNSVVNNSPVNKPVAKPTTPINPNNTIKPAINKPIVKQPIKQPIPTTNNKLKPIVKKPINKTNVKK